MGLFGGKKSCGVCGKELGLLGKRKLDDGVICKDCANKLSPFFSERRSSTLAQIQEQLAYREANKSRVAAFNPTRTLGNDMKVILDEDAQCFIVTRSHHWKDENPDVIDFSQVTGCNYEVTEHREEIKREKPDGTRESYNPPRYDIDYDFRETIHVNSEWFDEIEFQVNSSRIEQRNSAQYADAERLAMEIRDALTGVHDAVRQQAAQEAAPRAAVVCPACGATTTPDINGCCEYCGCRAV